MASRYGAAALGAVMLLGCGRDSERAQLPAQEERLERLERQLRSLLEEETEERIFLRNLRLLREYTSSHPELYRGAGEEQHQDHRTAQTTYLDFKSWSKRTLDSLAAFFVETP